MGDFIYLHVVHGCLAPVKGSQIANWISNNNNNRLTAILLHGSMRNRAIITPCRILNQKFQFATSWSAIYAFTKSFGKKVEEIFMLE